MRRGSERSRRNPIQLSAATGPGARAGGEKRRRGRVRLGRRGRRNVRFGGVLSRPHTTVCGCGACGRAPEPVEFRAGGEDGRGGAAARPFRGRHRMVSDRACSDPIQLSATVGLSVGLRSRLVCDQAANSTGPTSANAKLSSPTLCAVRTLCAGCWREGAAARSEVAPRVVGVMAANAKLSTPTLYAVRTVRAGCRWAGALVRWCELRSGDGSCGWWRQTRGCRSQPCVP